MRQVEASRSFPGLEGRVAREVSQLGTLDGFPEGVDILHSTPAPDEMRTPGAAAFFLQHQKSREPIGTPPLPVSGGGPGASSNHISSSFPFSSSSPVSSLDSGSVFTGSEPSFEAQLKASPMIRDILDRLVRCEFTTREIQRDIGEMHRKVNLLVDRSLHTPQPSMSGPSMSGQNGMPEFKDPFAPNNPSVLSPPLAGPRPSYGNIAPNQPAPNDDISSISQRLHTLTSSVGQLLAIQTQQIQSNSPALPNQPHNQGMLGNSASGDIAPNQVMSPGSMMQNNNPMMNAGLPSRPSLAQNRLANLPNPPMRTWSTGNLDLPARPADNVISRQGSVSVNVNESLLGPKRRSVSGLQRRDSSGVIDPNGDWTQGGGARGEGPLLSKWEQLPLSPELLRSLTKFGLGPPNKIQQRALPFLLRGSDIIAQAPPTQERIAAYVIPAIQIAVTHMSPRNTNRGPLAIMVSTTVDQATQAQRMIRDLGGPIGVRSALGVGAASASSDLSAELRLLQQNMPHIICGTPHKLHALFTSPGGLSGADVRFLVLDEVDQLIARNLHEFVFHIVKLLPPPRSRPSGGPSLPAPPPAPGSIFPDTPPISTANGPNPFGNVGANGQPPRKFSLAPSPSNGDTNPSAGIERQTALFSNTVPQDVLNLATAINLKEPVRVLVRRDGNVAHSDNQGSRNLRQFYLYLAFTAGGGRTDAPGGTPGSNGLGIIGSGRGATNAESTQAREWKLDALADLFDDVEVAQAIVHVGGMTSLDAVVYKLASRGLEAVPLHGDMNAGTKLAALNKFRSTTSVLMRPSNAKILVVYDVQVKTNEVAHVPLIVNYDLPKAVEEYAHRVAPAVAPNYARAGVVVNFVTATGGDVEMLRSIECFYKIKCPEVPMSLRDIV